MNLTKTVSAISCMTGLSRLFGMVREVLMAHALGAGPVADAFVVAFRLPNLFRKFLAEGAFNAAFVPLFAASLSNQGEKEAKRLAETVLAVFFWVLLGFVVLMEVVTPLVIYVLAPGFAATPERFDLTVDFTRLTFPYLLFISLAALFAGVLNTLHKFAVAAATPILLNICTIAALSSYNFFEVGAGYALCYGVIAAGIAQFLWLYVACKKAGMNLTLRKPKITPQVKELLKLMVPGIIGASVVQLNVMVDSQLASFLPQGSVSFLSYADRLNQLPLGVFGIAVSTAMLPILSKLVQTNDLKGAIDAQNKAIDLSLKLTLPCMVGLVLLSTPLISMLFGHGKFGAYEIEQTANALSAYAIGLPAYVLAKVLTNTFFAHKDTKTPVKIAFWVVGFNIVACLCLMPYLKHVGLALATAIASWLNAFLLYWTLKKKAYLIVSAKTIQQGRNLLLACLGLGVFMYFIKDYCLPGQAAHRVGDLLRLTTVMAVSGAVFLVFGRIFGLFSFSRIRKSLRSAA